MQVIISDSMPPKDGNINEVIKVRTRRAPLNDGAKNPMGYYGVINKMQRLQSYIWPKSYNPNFLGRKHRCGVSIY